jgi:hypothetical protein
MLQVTVADIPLPMREPLAVVSHGSGSLVEIMKAHTVPGRHRTHTRTSNENDNVEFRHMFERRDLPLPIALSFTTFACSYFNSRSQNQHGNALDSRSTTAIFGEEVAFSPGMRRISVVTHYASAKQC